MTLKQLAYAQALAQTLHYRKAAEACHVSQSALSTAISELEKQLGFTVFERNNKSVMVTPLGALVIARSQRILADVQSLNDLAETSKAPLAFPFKLGIIPTIAPYLLPRFFPALAQAYPKARVEMSEAQSADLVEQVRTGKLDAAILALPYPCDGLLTFEFWQEDFLWVCHPQSNSERLTNISSQDLKDKRLLLLSEGHCLKDHILNVCQLRDPAQELGLGATSLHTLVQMVRGGVGTTLIPAMAVSELLEEQGSLEAIPLKEPGPHRTIAFVVRPNFTRVQSVEVLIALCKQALSATSGG